MSAVVDARPALTLADDALVYASREARRGRGYGDANARGYAKALYTNLMGAQRFRFDAGATAAAAEVFSDVHTAFAMFQSARMPHQNVWLEWDRTTEMQRYMDQFEEGHPVRANLPWPPDAGAALLMSVEIAGFRGFLAHHYFRDQSGEIYDAAVSVMGTFDRRFTSAQEQAGELTLIDGDMAEIVERYGIPEPSLRNVLTGLYGALPVKERLAADRLVTMIMNHTLKWSPLVSKAHMTPARTKYAVGLVRGQYLFLVGLLAVINNNPSIRLSEPTRPRKHRFVSGKLMPYLRHHTVTLHANRTVAQATEPYRSVVGSSRAWHQTRGHWKQGQKINPPDPNCEHTWVPMDGKPDHHRCSGCGGRRWWCPDFASGTPLAGMSIHDHLLRD